MVAVAQLGLPELARHSECGQERAMDEGKAKISKALREGWHSGRKEPLWRGPEVDGITFSLLSRFLQCRERFRLHVVEGLRPNPQFNHKVEYGNMWHVCEEALAKGQDRNNRVDQWRPLTDYVKDLCRKYPQDQSQIDHWHRVCRAQFPLYVGHWQNHPDTVARTPLLQEQVFDVPLTLPSGRTVRLRGKWDSVGLVMPGKCNCGADRSGPSAEAHSPSCPAGIAHTVTGKGPQGGIWLQENKTKGDIRPSQVQRQLRFDLQTMLYLVALRLDVDAWVETAGMIDQIKGVRYNVVKRPLSGGKGTIVRHKATKNHPEETKDQFYTRMAEYIRAEPGEYFMRWNVEVSPADVSRFRRECLDPVLEQLCDWWGWISNVSDPFAVEETFLDGRRAAYNPIHWRHPFGCYNALDEGGSSDLDDCLETGSEVGLCRVDDLFPELNE